MENDTYDEHLVDFLSLQLLPLESFFELFLEFSIIGHIDSGANPGDIFPVGNALVDRAKKQLGAALNLIKRDIGDIYIQKDRSFAFGAQGDEMLKAILKPTTQDR